MDKFTYEGGRLILRNGEPFVTVGRVEGVEPVDVDAFARTLPELIDAARLVVARWAHGDLAQAVRDLDAALALLDWENP